MGEGDYYIYGMFIDQLVYTGRFIAYIVLWYAQELYEINNIIIQILLTLVKLSNLSKVLHVKGLNSSLSNSKTVFSKITLNCTCHPIWTES